METVRHHKKQRGQFKFEAYWGEEEETKHIIERAWDKQVHVSWFHKWHTKLQHCTTTLQKWSRENFSNNKRKLEILHADLKENQLRWDDNKAEIRQITQEINATWAREEQYWQQRSRIKWLLKGDANTSFFHHSTLAR